MSTYHDGGTVDLRWTAEYTPPGGWMDHGSPVGLIAVSLNGVPAFAFTADWVGENDDLATSVAEQVAERFRAILGPEARLTDAG